MFPSHDRSGDAIKDARLRLAMATYIDPVHGTTSTYSLATGITIEDMPSDSYLNNLGHVHTITSVQQSDFDVVDFMSSGTTLCHSINSQEIVESDPSITFHVNLLLLLILLLLFLFPLFHLLKFFSY